MDKIDYQARFRQSFEMALSYAQGALNNLECEAGNHKWSDWSANLGGNISQIQENPEKYKYFYRECINCRTEMPNSRYGQENYIDYKTWFYKQYSWVLDEDKKLGGVGGIGGVV